MKNGTVQTEIMVAHAAKLNESLKMEIYGMVRIDVFNLIKKDLIRIDGEYIDDLIIDAYLRALENYSSFNPEKGGFYSWLFKLVYNLGVDFVKKLARKTEIMIPDRVCRRDGTDEYLLSEVYAAYDDEGSHADCLVRYHDLCDILRQTVDRMPVGQRLAVDDLMNGRSIAEAVKIHGTNANTESINRHRARRCLLKEFDISGNGREATTSSLFSGYGLHTDYISHVMKRQGLAA